MGVVATLRSRLEKRAAVAAAPESADTPAMIASVVLDILSRKVKLMVGGDGEEEEEERSCLDWKEARPRIEESRVP